MKSLRFLVTAALSFVWLAALSAPRNLEQARKTAYDFYVQNAKTKATLSEEDFVLVYPRAVKSDSEQAPFYVFNFNNEKGFVIVNGDDDLRPILGYSLSNGFPTDVLPSNLQYWIDTYRQQIETYQEAVKNDTMQGDMGFSNAYPKTDAPAVGPLLENYAEGAINYNQREPYNMFCPDPDETGSPTVTGCVATAWAQIARYHKHPAQGKGHISYTTSKLGIEINHDFTDTYDWKNMLCDYNNYSYDPSSYTQAQTNAIATLMRDIGYASQMNYGYNESGAFSMYSLGGMQQYMGYSKAAELIPREYFTDKQWTELLVAELNAGRPIYYDGRNNEVNAGHAFVCDGYQADDFFHFNWGWGSWGNGWYWINNLVPTQTGTGAGNGQYNDAQSVVVNLKPDGGEAPVGRMYYSDYGHNPYYKKSFVCETGSYEKDATLSCQAYDFFNLSPHTLAVNLGVVYWGQDGSFVKAVLNPDFSEELQPYYGWYEGTFSINPGTDVPNGTYKISLCVRYNGSTWDEIKAQPGYTYAYTVTVREDGYKVDEIKSIPQVATPKIDQAERMFLDSLEVAITCTTPGASILYSLDGGSPSLTYTQPLVLKESASLRAIAVRDGMEASNEARAVYTCAREILKNYTSVANLRELREKGDSGTYYRVTGQVTVTYAASNYAHLYVEDSTGGMQIVDMPGPYRLTYRIGDVLENLCGRFLKNGNSDSYLDVPEGEIIPVFNPVTQVVPNARKTSMEQIEQNTAAYSGTLVEIENVRLANPEENTTWIFRHSYAAYQDDVDFYIYSFYASGQSYFDERIPNVFTLRGIVHDGMICPRTKSDIRKEDDPLPETYTLTVNASPSEGGTVSGSGTYVRGKKVTLTATANDGWEFTRWNDDNTQATRMVTVTEDTTYTAYFARQTDRETENLAEIKVYPNPSDGLFIVETGLPIKAKIYDNLGLLRETHHWNNAGKYTVDLRSCASGIYYLHLTSSSTLTRTIKLVVRQNE